MTTGVLFDQRPRASMRGPFCCVSEKKFSDDGPFASCVVEKTNTVIRLMIQALWRTVGRGHTEVLKPSPEKIFTSSTKACREAREYIFSFRAGRTDLVAGSPERVASLKKTPKENSVTRKRGPLPHK